MALKIKTVAFHITTLCNIVPTYYLILQETLNMETM